MPRTNFELRRLQVPVLLSWLVSCIGCQREQADAKSSQDEPELFLWTRPEQIGMLGILTEFSYAPLGCATPSIHRQHPSHDHQPHSGTAQQMPK